MLVWNESLGYLLKGLPFSDDLKNGRLVYVKKIFQ